MDDSASFRLTDLCLQHAESAIDPGAGWWLVVEVGFAQIRHTRRAKGREPLVEHASGFAELRVGAIAERQHRKTHALETRRVVRHQRRVEIDGALRRMS